VFFSAAAAGLANLALLTSFANFTVFLGTGDSEVVLVAVMMNDLSFVITLELLWKGSVVDEMNLWLL
jgi:hypothetical protein